MALPPPCTRTMRTPMRCMRTMSLMTSRQSSRSSMAAPPYFTTKVLPFILLIQGSASMRTCAFSVAYTSSSSVRFSMRPPS